MNRAAMQSVLRLLAAGALGLAVQPAASAPVFTDIEAGLPGVGFAESSVAWGDYDQDGDLDLALAGWSLSGNLAKVYRNDGGTFVDVGAGLTGVSSCCLAWGDYDNDGDLDLALAGGEQSGIRVARIYRNDGGTFTDVGAGLLGVWQCSLAWGDCDNDGDLDLALAGYTSDAEYVTRIYTNEGNGAFTDVGASLIGVKHSSSAWGDYDNDGDLDLAQVGGWYDGTWHPETRVYRNDGGGSFTAVAAPLVPVSHGSAAWGDYDNDGDLDLALAGAGGTQVSKIYRNDNGTFVDTAAPLPGVDYCSLAWGDYDNDGDLDLALAGYAGTSGLTELYQNDAGVFTNVGTELAPVYHASLAWGDYDHDGDLDLALVGTGPGGQRLAKVYRNDGAVLNTPPAAPDGLAMAVNGSDTTFSWNASADSETPSAGLSYNLRVGSSPGGNDVFAGMTQIGSGLRQIPAIGNAQKRQTWTLRGLADGTYYWSVQAVDTAYAGSAWAPERLLTRSPADADGDGNVDLDDFSVLVDCLAAPTQPPEPTPPRTSEECLSAFDSDHDDDVDLGDFAGFQVVLTE